MTRPESGAEFLIRVGREVREAREAAREAEAADASNARIRKTSEVISMLEGLLAKPAAPLAAPPVAVPLAAPRKPTPLKRMRVSIVTRGGSR